MSKIMLVLDNKEDQSFLEKVLERLQYTVITMKKGVDLSEQLIDHFPDVVFASTLGRNEKILSALGKIKEVRGKPKLVFVKQQKESGTLSQEQRKIIDGVLYSPVDPFKLIDLLASTTEVSIIELRHRYNDTLDHERRKTRNPERDQIVMDPTSTPENQKNWSGIGSEIEPRNYGDTKVIGKIRGLGGVEVEKDHEPKARGRIQIHDPERKRKYQEVTRELQETGEKPGHMDVKKLRSLQKIQSEQVQEGKQVKEDRKHFLKTLFSMSPEQVAKKKS